MGADWVSALERVGGRLVPAARVFLDSTRPPTPGPGADGVKWLAAQLEDFVDRESSGHEDDRFVEGAGAFLGLLLIDHLGGRTREREGCHRVQLGRFGWFDPFVAIQDVLDDEDPRGRLADYLAIAEQEAAADGPVSRVVRSFADALERERPDLDIRDQFELTVDLSNGATVDLARLERVARDRDEEATEQAARRIVSMLPGAPADHATPWREAERRLLPRLVSKEFLASLPSEQDLHASALGANVWVALQLRYESRARYVKRSEVDGWDLGPSLAVEHAIRNLADRSRSLRLEPVAPEVHRLRQGDGLDGARLLLPDLAARLFAIRGERWAAASPHRDVLLLAHGAGLEALPRLAADAFERAPHPVSPVLFDITPDGPRPLPE